MLMAAEEKLLTVSKEKKDLNANRLESKV
jgi:hypothetical protein